MISVYKFIKNNKFYFKKKLNNISKNIVLVEYNNIHASIIGYSYLSNVLANKYNANIFSYKIQVKKNVFKIIIWKFLVLFNLGSASIYRSFGVKGFLCSNIPFKKNYEKQSYKILKKIKNKEDVLNLKILNIYVGDLIYDSYLMYYKKPTININDHSFVSFFIYSLINFFFWYDFFNKNKVVSVITSHSVYTLAIPARIAISKNINSFQCTAEAVYKLNKKRLYGWSEFKSYKKNFSKLSKNIKSKSLILAKNKLIERFSGHISKDVRGSSKSAYIKEKYEPIIKSNRNIKILIATHCFFDNPHPYGLNLFSDFYDWLLFLGDISEKKYNYDFYIKLHPDYLKGTKEIIDNFLLKYKRIKLIDSKYSHHQIIKEGIDFAFTCWGSISHEYPYFDIPVINASLNNPHINYNFSVSPKNLSMYKKIVNNLEILKKKIKINKSQLIEFYAMHYVLKKDWLFIDLKNTAYHLGGYNKLFTTNIYKEWLREINMIRHKKIINELNFFLKSNKYCNVSFN
jgi:hypothetical protein